MVFLFVTLLVAAVVSVVAVTIGRMRPIGVEVSATGAGFAHPSRPVAALGLRLSASATRSCPPGGWRNRAKWVTGVRIGPPRASPASTWRSTTPPTSLVGVVIGVAVPRRGLPPPHPHRGVPGQLPPAGAAPTSTSAAARGEAIRHALDEQLGLEVDRRQALRPGGLGRVDAAAHQVASSGEPEHRAVRQALRRQPPARPTGGTSSAAPSLYGRLEDERRFSTVRRLVQYEDYLLRLMRDAGMPTAEPYGFVEITPEREYLLVTEFFDGAERDRRGRGRRRP